jgi:hypothetical protein
MPYIHKLVADGRECKLTIKQKRFKETGFASTGNAQGTSIVQHLRLLPRVQRDGLCFRGLVEPLEFDFDKISMQDRKDLNLLNRTCDQARVRCR